MKSGSLRIVLFLFIGCLLQNGCGESNYNANGLSLNPSQETEDNQGLESPHNENWKRVELAAVGKITYTDLATEEETKNSSFIDPQTGRSNSVNLSFTLVEESDGSFTADGEIGFDNHIGFNNKRQRYIFVDVPAERIAVEEQKNKIACIISGPGPKTENGDSEFKIEISMRGNYVDMKQFCDIKIIDKTLNIMAAFTAEIERRGGTGEFIAFPAQKTEEEEES